MQATTVAAFQARPVVSETTTMGAFTDWEVVGGGGLLTLIKKKPGTAISFQEMQI